MAFSESEAQRLGRGAAKAVKAAAIPNAAVAAAAPTKAEFDAVVAKLNSALTALRSAGIVQP